jgi:hypothetical protein
MTALPLALTVAVMALFAGCCTAVLFRYRKGRLAAEALHLLDRSEPALPQPVLPFLSAGVVLETPRQDLARLSGLTLAEAEDVLDWLEQNGYEERSLLCESSTSFSVEFRLDSSQVQIPTPHLSPLQRHTAG